mgnify:CR=1 FL=1
MSYSGQHIAAKNVVQKQHSVHAGVAALCTMTDMVTWFHTDASLTPIDSSYLC